MTLLGALFKNRRARDAHSAWNRPNLQGPETLAVRSRDFDEGGSMPRTTAGRRVGGDNVSPHLEWSPPPPETVELLLVVEDLDVPTPKPAVHCMVLIDPSRLEVPNELPAGGLSADEPAAGVRVLRSTISRGYHGPEPIKGHGPHRYTFQFFALSAVASNGGDGVGLDGERPRSLLSVLRGPVVARGRLTGTYER